MQPCRGSLQSVWLARLHMVGYIGQGAYFVRRLQDAADNPADCDFAEANYRKGLKRLLVELD